MSDKREEGVLDERSVSIFVWKRFGIWTAIFWGLVGIFGFLFFVGALDFIWSAKLSLYFISIWLNGWILAAFPEKKKGEEISEKEGAEDERGKMGVYHDCLSIWMISYTITNLTWEIPWLITSPFIFKDLETIDDVVAKTDYMRENILHLYWWVMASFSCVDLRTVNHNPTFYTLELFAFLNVASTILFFFLNYKRSPSRYLVVVLECGVPIAATFIFSVTEVIGGFQNMVGGVADTLLALVWTQYQYILFPFIFGWVAVQLLIYDVRCLDMGGGSSSSSKSSFQKFGENEDDQKNCIDDDCQLDLNSFPLENVVEE